MVRPPPRVPRRDAIVWICHRSGRTLAAVARAALAKQRELFKSWAQPRASDCYPGDLRLGWWWDLRSFGFGHYAAWSDDDISTVVTKTTYYEVWLSASGTRIYRKTSSWCDLPANLVVPVVLAAGAFVVAGLAVGAAKLVLWLW